MLDIGWTELLLIGIVALIVVGPKDLPHLFHTLGRITARARGMAREFSSAMEDAAKDSGLDDAAKSLRDVRNMTSKKSLGLDALDRATQKFEKWDPKRPEPKAAAPAATPDPAAPEPQATPVVAPDAVASDASADGPARRLHAVRRSDMKDD
ncbi:MAG: Sec-independent protein translocase protein TatB [Paracoccus sp.]|uniref:Sec-independent protein translocase protein TatB n=1 Tax=Paracoccus hibiscisoli TaxID=2023261 RepID=A0A4V5MTU3_9RHOB|nr:MULTISPECIES: Sec-independent protein translocase protein TatB [Paracoccus]MCG6112468.1 Sec-independent protein translocase protein TatB [Paracoccus sp. (in: a-proteobacteria)]ODT58049.1 MAG: twin arginine-targeting protein translocase TatB [Paracoccus sp. SCN 68-21]TJZ82508.1 twin-arginine translocase subunit TatB [Paracoccus hibiscisoli]